MPIFFFHLIDGAVGSMVLLPLVIILCAFIFEDLTTVVVGVLAADGIISVPIALLALYLGIALGDTTLYCVGALARSHPRLAHYIDHDFTAPFRLWLEKRYALIIFSGHFVPGLRLTSYTASGFFRYPLSAFVPPAIAGGLLLGTVLFFISYWFGSLTSEWVDSLRWGIALAFLLVLFFIGRHNVLAYRAKKNELPGL
jgi:membrane protein DedA with SNARE-associated domain